MRGGLLTTDLNGRILLMNRAGAEITGLGFGLFRGEQVQDVLPGFWPVEVDEHGNPWRAQGDRIPDSRRRHPFSWYFDFSAPHAARNKTTGFVFNFQDLTELRASSAKLSQKSAWRLSGDSPPPSLTNSSALTAMTGALKELARLAPLEDDDKKLVQIVSRESQRLNQIITDFLDYSREKNYSLRRNGPGPPSSKKPYCSSSAMPAAAGKYRIERQFYCSRSLAPAPTATP